MEVMLKHQLLQDQAYIFLPVVVVNGVIIQPQMAHLVLIGDKLILVAVVLQRLQNLVKVVL